MRSICISYLLHSVQKYLLPYVSFTDVFGTKCTLVIYITVLCVEGLSKHISKKQKTQKTKAHTHKKKYCIRQTK